VRSFGAFAGKQAVQDWRWALVHFLLPACGVISGVLRARRVVDGSPCDLLSSLMRNTDALFGRKNTASKTKTLKFQSAAGLLSVLLR